MSVSVSESHTRMGRVPLSSIDPFSDCMDSRSYWTEVRHWHMMNETLQEIEGGH